MPGTRGPPKVTPMAGQAPGAIPAVSWLNAGTADGQSDHPQGGRSHSAPAKPLAILRPFPTDPPNGKN